jgi:Tol biopolymer transport system component
MAIGLLATLLLLGVVLDPSRADVPEIPGKIVYIRDGNVWTAKANGNDPRKLTTTGDCSAPRWSPDGTKIMYIQCGHGTAYVGDVWVTDTNGNNGKKLTTSGDCTEASWSPDGTTILYRRELWDSGKTLEETTQEDTPYTQLWCYDLSSRSARRLLPDRNPCSPSWSPDGKWIAFLRSTETNSFKLEIVSPSGSGRRALANTERFNDVSSIAWSPSGNRIYCGYGNLTSRSGIEAFELPDLSPPGIIYRSSSGNIEYLQCLDEKNIAFLERSWSGEDFTITIINLNVETKKSNSVYSQTKNAVRGACFLGDINKFWIEEWYKEKGVAYYSNSRLKLIVNGKTAGTIEGQQVRWACGKPSVSACPQQVLSPVTGDFEVVSSLEKCTDTKWCFNQHKSPADFNPQIGHIPGGGIGGADDTYAWDINLNTPTRDSDEGKPVYAVAKGIVTQAYGGRDASAYGAVLIGHPPESPTWWSGYLHMTNIRVRPDDEVDENTVLGKISSTGIPARYKNNHLHFVVYRAQNAIGGLISFDVEIIPRTPSSAERIDWKEYRLGALSFSVPPDWNVSDSKVNYEDHVPGYEAWSDIIWYRFFDNNRGGPYFIYAGSGPKDAEPGEYGIVHYGSNGGQIEEPGTTSRIISITHPGRLVDSFKADVAGRQVTVCLLRFPERTDRPIEGVAYITYSFALFEAGKRYTFNLISADPAFQRTIFQDFLSRIRLSPETGATPSSEAIPKSETGAARPQSLPLTPTGATWSPLSAKPRDRAARG